MLGTVLSTEITAVNKSETGPVLTELLFNSGEHIIYIYVNARK